MGSTTARRLALLSLAGFVVALLISVISSAALPPYSRATTCASTSSDGGGMTCTTSTSGSEVLNNLVLGASALAMLVCLVAPVAAVVVAVRADVRARRLWQESDEEGAAPKTAASVLLIGAAACLGLGLLGTAAASWLADGVFAFPVLGLPEFVDATRLGQEYVRTGIALSLGVGALLLQGIGLALLVAAAVDAAAVAAAGRARSTHVAGGSR